LDSSFISVFDPQRHNPQQCFERIHHRNQTPEHIPQNLPAKHVLEAGGFVDGGERADAQRDEIEDEQLVLQLHVGFLV
jgi:hypothetical protein